MSASVNLKLLQQSLYRIGQGYRRLRLAGLRLSAQEGGKVVSPKHRPSLPPRKYSWYSFLLEVESTSGT